MIEEELNPIEDFAALQKPKIPETQEELDRLYDVLSGRVQMAASSRHALNELVALRHAGEECIRQKHSKDSENAFYAAFNEFEKSLKPGYKKPKPPLYGVETKPESEETLEEVKTANWLSIERRIIELGEGQAAAHVRMQLEYAKRCRDEALQENWNDEFKNEGTRVAYSELLHMLMKAEVRKREEMRNL